MIKAPRLRHGLAFSLPCLLFAGCTSLDPSPQTSTTRSALSGTSAALDDATKEARVVVKLTDGVGHCTGTLVTPLLVLTARHCVTGSVGEALPRWGLRPPFNVMDASTLVASVSNIRDAIVPNANPVDPNNPSDLASDIALVPVDAQSITPQAWTALLEARSTRPPNTPLPVTVDSSGTATYSVPFKIGGFGTTSTRRVATESRLQVGSGVWDLLYGFDASLGLEGGDSGGPIFVVRSTNGPREVIGVHSSAASDQSHRWFTDVTSATNASWLGTAALDHDHDGTRFTRWRTTHPSSTARWFGEVDYVGPCDTSRDRDCDHWDDAHDNCAYKFNPDQADRDDDGAGDACGGCPCDPDGDLDQDGVCAVLCSWQQPYGAADNCPRVYNPTQDNCNAASELAAQQRGTNVATLGDACDPVPCPNVDAVTSAGMGFQGICNGNPTLGYDCTGRKVRDGLALRYLAPEKIDDTQIGPNPFSDVHSAGDVSTYARFCQSNTALGFDCLDPTWSMHDARIADPELFDPSVPYHKVSVTVAGNPTIRGTIWSAHYPSGPVNERWDYSTDNTYWTGAHLIPQPGNYPNCATWSWSGTCLDGVFWTHGATAIGSDAAHPRDALGNWVGAHGAELANHHFALRPDEPVHFFINGVGDYHPVMPWVKFSDPYETGALAEARIIAIHATFDNHVFVFQHDATALDVTSLVSANANKVIGSAGVYFAPAVEPDRRLGTNSNIEALVLASTGYKVSELLVTDNGTLKTGTETGLFPFLTSNFNPGGRSGFAAVYSRVAGGLFLVGGQSTSTRTQMQDVWFMPLGRSWGQLKVTGFNAAGGVLAATYSFADQRLWVATLDGRGSASMYRIDPATGNATRVGTWTYTGTYVRHGFALDHNGSVLFFSKNANGNGKIAKVLVDSSGTAVASLIDRDEASLNRAPIVDENGYSLVHDNYTTERLTALRGTSGTFSLAEMF